MRTPHPAEAGDPPALLREIREQPEAARRTLAALDAGALRARLRETGGPPGRIVLAGSGTSRHAAELAARWFRRFGIAARARAATGIGPRLAESLPAGRGSGAVVVVTQSGATGSALRLLGRAAAGGMFAVVVTNEPESAAAGRADLALVTRAGPERAVPATKSFTSALLALFLLAAAWARAAGRISRAEAAARAAAGAGARDLLAAGLRHADAVTRFVARARCDGPWFFLGSGPTEPLAREGALKMMETAVVPALAIPAGELAHGPRALLRPAGPVIVLEAGGAGARGAARSLRAARQANAAVLRLVSGGGEGGGDTVSCPAGPGLEAFSMIPPLQLLALAAGLRLGRRVDRPPGLEKAVHDD